MHSKATTNRVKGMLWQGYPPKVIATRCKVSLSYVEKVQQGEKDDPNEWDRADQGAYLPDHEEILLKCAEIRKGWSDEQLASRGAGNRPQRWRVPLVRMSEADWGGVDETNLV